MILTIRSFLGLLSFGTATCTVCLNGISLRVQPTFISSVGAMTVGQYSADIHAVHNAFHNSSKMVHSPRKQYTDQGQEQLDKP